MGITRRPLREEVREAVLERLLDGSIAVGESINEPALAEELGVSRTPLREALLSLERDGILEARPGRGWWVAPLTADVVMELYPIIADLEALAVRRTPKDALDDGFLDELDRINEERYGAVDDPRRSRAIDDRWHELLVSRCPNRRLREEIASLKGTVVHRYEYPVIRNGRDVEASIRNHAEVTSALRQGKVAQACRALERQWEAGARMVADWLERQSGRTT
ncbi:MAG: GntR family transcriptional regulator [Acidimicrobiia bacterium]|nr:GntR family transcriptional regulator [Acidimicrobiia bacterium]